MTPPLSPQFDAPQVGGADIVFQLIEFLEVVDVARLMMVGVQGTPQPSIRSIGDLPFVVVEVPLSVDHHLATYLASVCLRSHEPREPPTS